MAHLLHTPQNGQTKIEGQPTNHPSAATRHRIGRTFLPCLSPQLCPPHTDAGASPSWSIPSSSPTRHTPQHHPTTRTARTPGRHTVSRPKLLTPAAPFHHLLLRRLSVGFLSPLLHTFSTAQPNTTATPPSSGHLHGHTRYLQSRTRPSSSPTAHLRLHLACTC